ncbi:F-box protein At2g26160-like [Argentina anserina]|uniref:F-box protein At2g26160-like n=1 Tax=Argentina anserina TaxID=57926 RepID=UPI00217622B0|nr:F-box protein At2g26160-like [Potentilla anserina]
MRSSDWADLPEHLLDSVLKRLPSTSDYMHFSTVCTAWNSVAKLNLSRKRIVPMLLAYSGKDSTWNLCDITRDKVLDLQLELPKRRYFGFSKGWLITMDENSVVTLVNPFSRVKGMSFAEKSIIKLPALKRPQCDAHHHSDIYIYKAMISADPIYAKDCTVVIIYGYLMQLAFIRLESLDTDKTWTYINEGVRLIHDVVYVEDKFFAVDGHGSVMSFLVTPNQEVDVKLVGQYFGQPSIIKRYLVELSDRKELVMVQRYRMAPPERETTKFELFQLHADTRKWNEITSLGDAALFLGENSSISLMAPEVLGCLPNCIYFLHDYHRVPRKKPRDFGLYNIKTASFLPVDDTQAATLIKMSNQIPIWVMPKIKL